MAVFSTDRYIYQDSKNAYRQQVASVLTMERFLNDGMVYSR